MDARIEVKVEPYDGTYACGVCFESVRGQPALKCSRCSSNPVCRACVEGTRFREQCLTCRGETMEMWKGASAGTAPPSEIIDVGGGDPEGQADPGRSSGGNGKEMAGQEAGIGACDDGQKPPEPVMIDGKECYEVEAILAERLFGRKRQVLVKWAGYVMSSWEPRANMPRAVLRSWEAMQQRSGGSDGSTAADTLTAEGCKKRPEPDGEELVDSSEGGERAEGEGRRNCGHHRQRNLCKECGGASICQHEQQRSTWAGICEHNRRKSTCKECSGKECRGGQRTARDGDEGGSSRGGKQARAGKPGRCEHNRRKNECRECGGASICQHARQRHLCKECGGASICQHARQRHLCKECGGASICQHARQRHLCKECGGASICEHKRQKHVCRECGGSSICQHRRQRGQCKTCKADKDESMPPVSSAASSGRKRIIMRPACAYGLKRLPQQHPSPDAGPKPEGEGRGASAGAGAVGGGDVDDDNMGTQARTDDDSGMGTEAPAAAAFSMATSASLTASGFGAPAVGFSTYSKQEFQEGIPRTTYSTKTWRCRCQYDNHFVLLSSGREVTIPCKICRWGA